MNHVMPWFPWLHDQQPTGSPYPSVALPIPFGGVPSAEPTPWRP